jgi:cellulose synthase/poly-beta-1,6-N-acetylglucosamine synthase-like glycosyltransferase
MNINFSVIVPAYREKNINKLLNILIKQNLPKNMILDKIIIIAAGYENFHFLKNRKIEFIEEKEREGKASAINLGLKKVSSDIVVLESGDTLPNKNTIKNLLKPFEDPEVGMTTGRPIPLDDPKKFMGFLAHLVWLLHHLISFEKPKGTEISAFRKIFKKIPKKLATDEVYIELEIFKKGYQIVYVPRAIVYNKNPARISDFLKQRRRIFTGHIHLKSQYHYAVSTLDVIKIFEAIFKYFRMKSIKSCKQMIFLFFAIFLEVYARFLGSIDYYVFNKVPYVWEIIKSSRR